MLNKLYTDLVGSIVSIFNHHPTPLLLPFRTINELIKQNSEFFRDTISSIGRGDPDPSTNQIRRIEEILRKNVQILRNIAKFLSNIAKSSVTSF